MRIWIAVVAVMLALQGWAAAASADSHAASATPPAAEARADACLPIIETRYPWLQCAPNASGGRSITSATVAANASWDTDRSIPYGHVFVEGDGWWGPSPR
jgi:hypothetical protein